MIKMNSRERVIAAINNQQPDRVPIDMGSIAASGIVASAYVRLREKLGLGNNPPQIFNLFGMMVFVEPEVMEYLGIDTMLVPALCPRFGIPIDKWKPWKLLDGTPVQVPVGFETVEDKDGNLLLMVKGEAMGKMPKDGHHFSEIANTGMGESGLDSLEDPPDTNTQTFSLLTDEDLQFRHDVAQNLYQSTDKALIVDLEENIRWNTSIANWMFAVAAAPERCLALHMKKAENLLGKVKQLYEAVGPYVNVFAIYQDYGAQKSEVISPEAFERLSVPPYKIIFDWIHQNTHWKVMFHSCGSIYKLIPHMIEMGVDILNPVQCETACMGPKQLKDDFGEKLVFWGGGCDTQSMLPHGTPDEVRQQVKERISTLGANGGYVFAPTQDIQADVPAENMVAMFEAAKEYANYPLEIK